MAETCGISLRDLPEAWAGLKLAPGRFQPEKIAGVSVIYDGYNASPVSFEAALEQFRRMEVPGKKYLVFADMLELGPEEIRFHEKLGEKIAACGLDGVWAYGRLSKSGLEAASKQNPSLAAVYCSGALEAGEGLARTLRPGDSVLLKASRGMKIEEALKPLRAKEPQKDEKILTH
jgi:UDP-N-acetylmuramoyl-tripeptide--D-alanyl-D-alanine ligase